MKPISVHPDVLIPTDHPRSLVGILKFIPLIISGDYIDPIIIVPISCQESDRPDDSSSGPARYFVCKFTIYLILIR